MPRPLTSPSLTGGPAREEEEGRWLRAGQRQPCLHRAHLLPLRALLAPRIAQGSTPCQVAPEARLPPVSWGNEQSWGACWPCLLGCLRLGKGGPQASSSGVPALPAEALALSITSIHLRGGVEVRTAPPTARLGGRACSGPQIGGLVPQHLPMNDPKSRGKGLLNPGSSAQQPL